METQRNLRGLVPLLAVVGLAVGAPGASGGVGTDQAGGIHHSGRHRRRRRSDGASAPGHRRQAQPHEAVAHPDQQIGRGGRGRVSRRQSFERRPAQDHHHAFESVHDAARDRRALQLERHDAGRDARARPVRAVGQCRDALQERQGLHRSGQESRARTSSRWRAPAPSRKTRSSPWRSRKRPARNSPTFLSRAAATWRRSSSASTSIRR